MRDYTSNKIYRIYFRKRKTPERYDMQEGIKINDVK